MNKNIPFTYDIVGSFLRPEYLKEARTAYKNKEINYEALKEIEDKAIKDLIDKLVDLDYKVVTDGEYRRGWYHSDFLASLKGVKFTTYEMNLFGQMMTVGSTELVDKLAWNPNHPFLEHFAFAKRYADSKGVTLKFDIPGPNMILLDTITTDQPNVYKKDITSLASDLTQVYIDAVQAFYDQGCRYLQLDDPVWVSLCDAKFKANIQKAGFDVFEVKSLFNEMATHILAHKPQDLAITLHMCQGNLRSQKFYDATYDDIVDTIFALPFDGFFMEFDDDKYCNFKLLKKLQGQKVILGIVSTRSSELEDKDVLIKRVNEAKAYVDASRLGVATQCGFASTAEGNIISEDAQWAKLALLRDVAKETLVK